MARQSQTAETIKRATERLVTMAVQQGLRHFPLEFDFLLFCSEFCQMAPSHLWGPRPTLLLSDIAPSVVAREKLGGI